MVATGANETLSMKQAKQIVEKANQIVTSAAQKMVSKNDEFVDSISRIWEDQNAVDFMQKHKANFEDFISEMKKNSGVFANTVNEIANAYAKAGGISASMAAQGAVIGGVNIMITKVKTHFADSENGDDFGFKNPARGADQVMDAFKTLKSGLIQDAADAVNQIKQINAFGNKEVQINLAQSAGKIIEILKDHIEASETQIKSCVDQTAKSYMSLGSSAATSAKLSTKQ